MQEEYFKKTDMSELFKEVLKQNPEQKQFLINLWSNIKALPSVKPEKHSCQRNCDSCLLKEQCDMFDKAKLLFEHYSAIQETDAYWSDFVRNSTRYAKKYKDHRFARILAQAVLEEISETAKSLPEYQNWAVEVERR